MTAMMDATCPKCGKRIGWCGRCVDRPPCPRCGHRPPDSVLAADDAQLEEFEQLLLARPVSGHVCRKQRVAAGLTLIQAAARLGLAAPELARFERGEVLLPDDVVTKMAELYGCGED